MEPWTLFTDTCRSWNLDITEGQIEQLKKYADLLTETNKVMNLTAITDEAGIVEKHFMDSLSSANAVDYRGGKTLLDVGTGAGFPGIPLKILFPDLQVVLLDSLAKRVNFLNRVIEELGLEKITAVHGRAEDFARKPEYRDHFDLVTSRAVARLSVLAEYCLPFVRPGGLFVSYKAGDASAEAKDAEYAVKILGAVREKEVMLTFGPSSLERTFYLFRKEKPTPKAYPRKAGTPEKKPLVK